MLEISSASQICLRGCLLAIFSSILSFLKIFCAISVLVIVGAIQFTLTVGASSAASDFVNPSTPDLATETDA